MGKSHSKDSSEKVPQQRKPDFNRQLNSGDSANTKLIDECPGYSTVREAIDGNENDESPEKYVSPPIDPSLKDPYCDPENPVTITLSDIKAAAEMIGTSVDMTPCPISHMSALTGMDIYFKKDFMQHTGSFKERGARVVLMKLSPEQRKGGVIAASAGNHAQALAYHGHALNVPVTVVMPAIAPLMKIQNCKLLHANVILQGNDLSEAKQHAMQLARKHNMIYINGYDHPHILAGQGTMGLEILKQVPLVDAVLVPIGGGSLIAGISVALKALRPEAKIYGVEAERCAGFTAAMKAGKPVFIRPGSSLADGLAVPMVGVNAFATARHLTDKVLVVPEEFLALAILRLIEMEKAVVEGAGASGFAAVLAGLCPELKGKKVVIPLTGGNIDTTVLGRCLDRGLAADGRLCRFAVTVSDRPGGIADLTKLIASIGVSIKDINQERAWLRADVFSVEVKCVVETRDCEHCKELQRLLSANYSAVRFGTT